MDCSLTFHSVEPPINNVSKLSHSVSSLWNPSCATSATGQLAKNGRHCQNALIVRCASPTTSGIWTNRHVSRHGCMDSSHGKVISGSNRLTQLGPLITPTSAAQTNPCVIPIGTPLWNGDVRIPNLLSVIPPHGKRNFTVILACRV